MIVLVSCKNKEEQIKNEGARVVTRFSQLLPYGSYLLPWKPEFWSDLTQNLMQSVPHPNDASDEILIIIGQLVSEIFMFESVDTQTDTRTQGCRLESHTISSPWAFSSGELINMDNDDDELFVKCQGWYKISKWLN